MALRDVLQGLLQAQTVYAPQFAAQRRAEDLYGEQMREARQGRRLRSAAERRAQGAEARAIEEGVFSRGLRSAAERRAQSEEARAAHRAELEEGLRRGEAARAQGTWEWEQANRESPAERSAREAREAENQAVRNLQATVDLRPRLVQAGITDPSEQHAIAYAYQQELGRARRGTEATTRGAELLVEGRENISDLWRQWEEAETARTSNPVGSPEREAALNRQVAIGQRIRAMGRSR